MRVSVSAAAAAGTLFAAGCGPAAPTAAPPAPPTVSLRVACADPAFADAIRQPARAWAVAQKAAVEVVARPPAPGDDADVVIVPAAELGVWAERGDLLPVPKELRAEGPYHWAGVYPAYRDTLAAWGGQAQAVPLSGDGVVLVVRADRLTDPKVREAFRAKFGKPPTEPATWEDLADLAEVLTDLDTAPALPPLPAADAAVADLFFRVAACYDRGSVTAGLGKAADKTADARESLSFQFRVDTGRPRLDAPSFAAAARWLARTRPLRGGGTGDPAAALADGKAMLAVLSLAELARLPKENGVVPPRFGLAAAPPGAREFFPAGAAKPLPAATGRNYIPYFANARLGAVRKGCPHPEKAFDLLAELGGPARSLERLSGAKLGAGPVRTAEWDVGKLTAWYGYGFDRTRSRRLQEAMKSFVAESAAGATFVLRGPDQAALTAALATELRQVAAGEVPPDVGLKQAAAAWDKLDAAQKPDDVLRWRRRAAGLP